MMEGLKEFGLDTKTGLEYTGGEDQYKKTIARVAGACEENKAAAREAYAAGDLEGYRIRVHAVKSNLRMIGAAKLAKRFEMLEFAARDADRAVIEGQTEPVFAEYTQLMEKLRSLSETKESADADEISAEEAKQTAAKLLEALDEFDDELSLSLAKRLSGYPFGEKEQGLLQEAVKNIDGFMYDEAAELVNEIAGAIQD